PSVTCASGGVRPQWALRRLRRRRAVMFGHRRGVAGAARTARSSAWRFAMSRHDYIRDGDAIYQRSFAIIRAETDLSRFSADEADIVVRMVHACGSPEVANHILFGHGLAAVARTALADGAPILCDSEMVAHGITRARLPASNDAICTLHDPRVPEL